MANESPGGNMEIFNESACDIISVTKENQSRGEQILYHACKCIIFSVKTSNTIPSDLKFKNLTSPHPQYEQAIMDK